MAEILRSTSDVLYPAELGEKVVEVNSRDVDGDTPLHVMVWRSDLYGVKALIEAGAELDAVGDMGSTPLYVAVMKQSEEIADILLCAGSDPDVRSEFGNTSRELATGQGGAIAQLFSKHAQQAVAADRAKPRSG